MKGRPWLRFVLVILGFAAMGIPVWLLTSSSGVHGKVDISFPVGQKVYGVEIHSAGEQPAPAVEEKEQTLAIHLTFATAPEKFILTYLDKPVLTGAGPATEFKGTWSFHIPKEGVDLLLKAKWPANIPRTAVQVTISKNGSSLVEKTFWAKGDLVEIITIPGDQ